MRIQGFLKLVFEFSPLAIFFFLNASKQEAVLFGYKLEPIFLATAGFIAATVVSLIGMYVLMRRIPIMPLISGVFVLLFGGMTLILHDEVFIKTKPTFVNTLFGTILLVGLYFNRLFIKLLLAEGLSLKERGWRSLTLRWGLFFFFLAALNEFVWRVYDTDSWVLFKTVGIIPLTLIFALAQIPLIQKYWIEIEEDEDAEAKV